MGINVTNKQFGGIWKLGNTVDLWTITSTTTAESVARNFASFSSGTLINIHVPEAKKDEFLCFDAALFSQYPHEKEVLCAPGIQIEINGIKKDSMVELQTTFVGMNANLAYDKSAISPAA